MHRAVMQRIIEIVACQLGVTEESVKPESLLIDLGADSLDMMEIIMYIEEGFDVEIPDSKVPELGALTVQRLFDLAGE